MRRRLGTEPEQPHTSLVHTLLPTTRGSPALSFPDVLSLSPTPSRTVPERMARLVVYPVPLALSFIWGLVRPFLAPKTAEKIRMLGGAAGSTSPCPVRLGRYVRLDALREADRPRHAAIEGYRPEPE